jgi:hypothetical protein
MGSRGLSDHDTDAVQDAVDALNDAGFDVTRITDVKRTRSGVEVNLTAMTNTRTKPMGDDVDA